MRKLLRLFLLMMFGFMARPVWADAIELTSDMHGLAVGPSLRFIAREPQSQDSSALFMVFS